MIKPANIFLKPYVKLCTGKYRDAILDFHLSEVIVFPKNKLVSKSQKNAICLNSSSKEYVEHFASEQLLTIDNECLSYDEPITSQFHKTKIEKLYISSSVIDYINCTTIISLLKEKHCIRNIVIVVDSDIENKLLSKFSALCNEAGVIHISLLLDDVVTNIDNHNIFDSVIISCTSIYIDEHIKFCMYNGIDYFIDESIQSLQHDDQFTCSYDNYIRLKNRSYFSNQIYLKSKHEVSYTPLLSGVIEHYESVEELLTKIELLLENSFSYSKSFAEKCKDCEYRFVCNHPCIFKIHNDNHVLAPYSCHYKLVEGEFSISGNNNLELSYCATIGAISVNTNSKVNPTVLCKEVVDELNYLSSFFEISFESLLLSYNYIVSNDTIGNATIVDYSTESIQVIINTSCRLNLHELIHALFFIINKTPTYLIAEATAYIFGDVLEQRLFQEYEYKLRIKEIISNSPQLLDFSVFWDKPNHYHVPTEVLFLLGYVFRYAIIKYGVSKFLLFYSTTGELYQVHEIYGLTLSQLANEALKDVGC
jgi:radical SAM protein with 4Fe4S-binding SPASM domain